jgi:hypothetical protein
VPAGSDDEPPPYSAGPTLSGEPAAGSSPDPAGNGGGGRPTDVLVAAAADPRGPFATELCARFHDGGLGPARTAPDVTGYATVSPLACAVLVGGYSRRPARFESRPVVQRVLQRTPPGAVPGGGAGQANGSAAVAGEWVEFREALWRVGASAASAADANASAAQPATFTLARVVDAEVNLRCAVHCVGMPCGENTMRAALCSKAF